MQSACFPIAMCHEKIYTIFICGENMRYILNKSAAKKLLTNLLLAVLVILAYKAIMNIEEIAAAVKGLMGTISSLLLWLSTGLCAEYTLQRNAKAIGKDQYVLSQKA